MVTLGGVALGYDIIWTDRHQSDGVYQLLPQRLVVVSGLLYKQKQLDTLSPWKLLTNKLDSCRTYSNLKMASQPDVAYDFDFHGLESFQVMFGHYEPPALALRPLIDGAEYGEWFIGTIKLFTV